MSALLPTSTLSEARAWLRGRLMEGAHCPVCRQNAKVYRRQIHSGMARVLIAMWRQGRRGWIYLPDIAQKSRDSSYLALWNLIEASTEPREDGGRAGWWRVTPEGEQFVQGRTRVPRYALVYDGSLLRHEGEPIDINDALGSRFNLRELLEGTSTP